MYIIAIGWLYVTVLMALTETSVAAGILTFVFYGLLPVALLMWLLSSPVRLQRRRLKEAQEAAAADAGPGSTGAAADQLGDAAERNPTEADQ